MERSKASLTVFAILLGIFITAIDQTIISTAIPTIIAKLGGFEYFSWTFSAYMVAGIVTIPIMGKLSDMYGRRRLLIASLILFMAGSLLCGFAHTMTQLIVFRAIQGIGGGAIMPIAFPLIFDMFPAEKRGKMIGLISMVYGVSSVFGPIVGGLITEYLSWNWVFFLNIPFGTVSIIMFAASYREKQALKKQAIDWTGILFILLGLLSLMLAIELGGNTFTWTSLPIIGLFAGFVLFLGLFIRNERKAADPVIRLDLFRNRTLVASLSLSFLYGSFLIICVTYIPFFVQAVLGGSASSSSTVLTPMMLSVVAGSMLGGLLVNRFAFRTIMVGSAVFVAAGLSMLSTLTADTTHLTVIVYMIVVGLGIGTCLSVVSMSTMNSVESGYRGTASSLSEFSQSLGSTLGIAVFSVLQSKYLMGQIRQTMPQVYAQIGDGKEILRKEFQRHLAPDALHKLLGYLAGSIAHVYQWAIGLSLIAVLAALLLGKSRLTHPQTEAGEGQEE